MKNIEKDVWISFANSKRDILDNYDDIINAMNHASKNLFNRHNIKMIKPIESYYDFCA